MKGHVIGLIAVVATAGGEDETTIAGEFSADLGYARAAAREGFDLLLGHWSEQAKYTLPRRLRTRE